MKGILGDDLRLVIVVVVLVMELLPVVLVAVVLVVGVVVENVLVVLVAGVSVVRMASGLQAFLSKLNKKQWRSSLLQKNPVSVQPYAEAIVELAHHVNNSSG